MGISVCTRMVPVSMTRSRYLRTAQGLFESNGYADVIADYPVNRKFRGSNPNKLWVNKINQKRVREGWPHRCAEDSLRWTAPSFRPIGDGLDNAVMDSAWF
jgi:hypothetical protein